MNEFGDEYQAEEVELHSSPEQQKEEELREEMEKIRAADVKEREDAILKKLEGRGVRDADQVCRPDQTLLPGEKPVEQCKAGETLSMSREQLLDQGEEEGSLSRAEPSARVSVETLGDNLQHLRQPESGHHEYQVTGYEAGSREEAIEAAKEDLESLGFESEKARIGDYGSDLHRFGKQEGAELQLWRDSADGKTQEHLRIMDAKFDGEEKTWTVTVKAETPDE